MNTFFTLFSANSSSATGNDPYLKYTFSGILNHNIFSLLSATVLTFIKWLTPTFSETEFPPHDPHPNVNEGANLKL